MLFALALGVMFGAAGVVLVQQWLRGSVIAPRLEASGDRFPRLASPVRSLR